MVTEFNKNRMENMPDWLFKLNNLMSAVEIYRNMEEQAVSRIKTILKEKGIVISEEEIKKSTVDSIKERMKQAKEERMQEEREENFKRNEEEGRKCRR